MNELRVGVDIGGTNTAIGLVDNSGNLLAENSLPTNKFLTIESFIIALTETIKISLSSIKGSFEIKGIGIGAPNGNFYSGNIEFAPNLNWKGVIPLVELLKMNFDVPIVLTNDANAAAMGEMIYGSAKGMKNFIVVTLGTGLGSGFVVNGEIVYGGDGFAGELGHVIIDSDGRLCGCGRKGCLETYVSATGIKNTVIEFVDKKEYNSSLKEINIDNLNSKDIYNAAKEGDKLALNAFDYTAKQFGIQLANAIAITSPEAIFLFGGLALSGDYILKPTKKYMEENLLEIYKNKVKLELSGLMGKNAAVLGAAALV